MNHVPVPTIAKTIDDDSSNGDGKSIGYGCDESLSSTTDAVLLILLVSSSPVSSGVENIIDGDFFWFWYDTNPPILANCPRLPGPTDIVLLERLEEE